MFIFEANDKELEYYFLVNLEGENPPVLEVLIYLDRIFLPLESYSLDRIEQARGKCQEFLELDKSIFSILIKSSQEITIWIAKEQFQLASFFQKETAITSLQKTEMSYHSIEPASQLKCLTSSRIA